MAPDNRRPLRYLGDEALRVVCEPVEDQGIAPGLVESMRAVIRSNGGAGLAANQVGGTQRVILVAVGSTPKWSGEPVVMINPRITFRSPETVMDQEGCLSMPGFFTTLRRHKQIRVDFLDDGFASKSIIVAGFDARCVQHEIDHLDGKLIVDGLSRQQRRQAERLVAKATA